MIIVADTLSGWRAVPWADEQSDPRDRACEVTSHDGDNPSKWRYESAPWKGATAENQKGKQFFFLYLYLFFLLSVFGFVYFSRSAASTTPGLSIIWGFNTQQPKFVSLEYPRADGTILIVELSWTTESWVPIRIRTEIFHARLKLGSKLTAPKNWSNEEKKFFFQKICRNHHGTVFVRRAKTWVGFEQDFWNFFFLVACRALNFWTWRNNF